MHYGLGDYVLDIAQNAVEAGSGEVVVALEESAEGFRVTIQDDGCGMTEDERARALDPFYTDGKKHAKRKVGLGLPFLVEAVELAGGSWSLESKKGEGTRVEFFFPSSNIDSPPTGDVAGLILGILCLPGSHEMLVRRTGPRGSYELKRSELSEAVGGLERASSLGLLKDYLVSMENDE
jgi:Signal transduction histidine kinase